MSHCQSPRPPHAYASSPTTTQGLKLLKTMVARKGCIGSSRFKAISHAIGTMCTKSMGRPLQQIEQLDPQQYLAIHIKSA